MATMPSVAEFMHNHHVYGRDSVVNQQDILYFFTCHHCFNILVNAFKCTGKSTSICMTAGDDTDEGVVVKQPYVLHSIKFQNVFLCMSMYMWELFTRAFSSTQHSP